MSTTKTLATLAVAAIPLVALTGPATAKPTDTTIAISAATAAAPARDEQVQKKLPKVHYTNRTKVTKNCPIHWNYPKRGVNDQIWPAGPSTGSRIVGVRYTTGPYALVRDGQRQKAQTASWWGWISKDCLLDPVARKFPRVKGVHDVAGRPDPEGYAPRIADGWATGGDNAVKRVDISPRPRRLKGSVGVGTAGTLRNGPNKFAIGAVGAGWTFKIARTRCRRTNGQPYKPSQWIFGYSPDARRWGWVQAIHLPACTS